MREDLQLLQQELQAELENILSYWMAFGKDEQQGGFIGRVDNLNQADPVAAKGSVLNSRILWTFSAAYNLEQKPVYLQYAQRAYQYLTNHFIDRRYGGVYWSVDYTGHPADKKKQVYAQAFALYALSEFFRATGAEASLQEAVDLFEIIEQFSYDEKKGGYIDAFTESWTVLEDIRLSEKDANEKKTMNTHLHILEAYTNLYRIWPQEKLKTRITGLLQNFFDHIIDASTCHLVLFFDEHWNRRSTMVSYGHDIEAAWLLQEAAEAIKDVFFIAQTKQMAVKMASAAAEGLDKDGGLWYEYEPAGNHLIKEKHWWPQAEAMVGFFNAWEVSNEESYLQKCIESWHFARRYIVDHTRGEWVWGIKEDYSVMSGQDKVGIWKCPYHNGRACMEIVRRINQF